MLYRNNGNDNHWLSVNLQGTVSNRNGIGAKVFVNAIIGGESVWQMREIITHSGHVTQGSLKAHFGLGEASIVDSIIVVWPNQEEQILSNVNPDQILTIVEETSTSINEATLTKQQVNLKVTPNPFVDQTGISFNLEKTTNAKIKIWNLKGQLVAVLFEGQLHRGRHQFFMGWKT